MRRRVRTRLLTTVLFTDIVRSTQLAAEMGDQRWRELVNRHNDLVQRELRRFGGKEIDTAGDGFFATFEGPDSAIRCAVAITESVRALGIEVRAGTHVGEAEVAGNKMRGIAVHIGARVMSLASRGQVFATGTVRDLVAGAGISFKDHGEHELKGVPDKWQVLEVTTVEGIPRTPALEEEEARKRRAEIQVAALIKQRLSLVLVAVALVAALAAAGLFATRRDGSLASFPGNSIGLIETETSELTAAFELDAEPISLAVSKGVVWVVSQDAGTLTRIDPEAETIGPIVATLGGPAGVAVDEAGSVWVLNQFEGTAISFDPRQVDVEGNAQVGAGAKNIAAGEGAVWVTNETNGTLVRIDPDTHGNDIVLGTDELGDAPYGVAVGGGSVWVTAGRKLVKFNPRTFAVEAKATLRFESQDVAYGAGFVWVLHESDDMMSKVDPDSLQAVTVHVGNLPVDVAVGGGWVWVANAEDGTVSRVNPTSNEVQVIETGNSPQGVAVEGDRVFVAVARR